MSSIAVTRAVVVAPASKNELTFFVNLFRNKEGVLTKGSTMWSTMKDATDAIGKGVGCDTYIETVKITLINQP